MPITGIQTGTNWKFMLQRCPLIYGLRYKNTIKYETFSQKKIKKNLIYNEDGNSVGSDLHVCAV